MEPTLLHNPRCSKSREALALLRERGLEPRVVEYLETPPSAAELEEILGALGLEPQGLLRRGEELYRELEIGSRPRTRAELVALMAEHPILIERPVFLAGERAVVGRPPERVLELLG